MMVGVWLLWSFGEVILYWEEPLVVLQSSEVLAAWLRLGGEICINSAVNQSGAAGLAAVERLVASRRVR